jgi:hypothetical protein
VLACAVGDIDRDPPGSPDLLASWHQDPHRAVVHRSTCGKADKRHGKGWNLDVHPLNRAMTILHHPFEYARAPKGSKFESGSFSKKFVAILGGA